MASIVGICNNALIMLGENVITSLEDNNKPARTLNAIYENKRDYLFRKYQWKFAIKRITLSSDVTTPEFEYDYQFTLPSDCIQFLELYPDYISYRIEKNKILCGETTLYIKYTQRITDPNEMDSTFREALAALLARETAIPLTDSLRKQNKMDELFEDKLADARFSNSIEDDLEEVKADDWLTQRM